MAGQDGAEPVLKAGEGLVERHAGPAGIGEEDFDAVIDQTLDKDIGAFLRGLRFVRHG
jgi:hypothetical protein